MQSEAPLLIEMMLSAPLCAIRPGGGTIHAVDMEALSYGFRPDVQTLISVCGVDGLKVIGERMQTERALPWPPAVRGLAPAIRCRECWEKTGKKRPRSAPVLGGGDIEP